MEGDYRKRVDGIFKKFGKSPTPQKSLLKRNSSTGSGETRLSQFQRSRSDRGTQRSKKSPVEVSRIYFYISKSTSAQVRSSTTSIIIEQCFIPSLTVDLGTLPQISTHLAPSIARCCEKCLPTSRVSCLLLYVVLQYI